MNDAPHTRNAFASFSAIAGRKVGSVSSIVYKGKCELSLAYALIDRVVKLNRGDGGIGFLLKVVLPGRLISD